MSTCQAVCAAVEGHNPANVVATVRVPEEVQPHLLWKGEALKIFVILCFLTSYFVVLCCMYVIFCLFCFLSLDRPCTTVKRCGKTKNYRRLASWSMSRKSYQRYPKYSQEMFAMLIKKCLNVIFRSEPCRTSLVTSLSTTRWAYSKWPSYKAWAWAWCNWEITGNKPFLTSWDLKMRLPKTLKNIDGRTVRRIMREDLDRPARVAPCQSMTQSEAMKCGRVDWVKSKVGEKWLGRSALHRWGHVWGKGWRRWMETGEEIQESTKEWP